MAETLSYEVVTPLGIHKGETATEITVPAATGEMGVLPGHDVMIVAMGTGALSVTSADGTDIYFVSRGYAEIDNDHIRILAETCEEKGEINVERAEAALQRAEERLKEVSGEIDWNRAEEAHKRAEHRIKIAKGE